MRTLLELAPGALTAGGSVLGGELQVRTITLAPPLARRVGAGLYGPLARIPALRTHRLVVARF